MSYEQQHEDRKIGFLLGYAVLEGFDDAPPGSKLLNDNGEYALKKKKGKVWHFSDGGWDTGFAMMMHKHDEHWERAQLVLPYTGDDE